MTLCVNKDRHQQSITVKTITIVVKTIIAQDDGESCKARTSSLKRSVSRRSSSSSRLSLLSKKVETRCIYKNSHNDTMKFWKNSQEYFRTKRCEDVLQDESEVCITDAQSLDRLSLQSQEELEEVNIERYLQVLPVIIIVNITIIVNIIIIIVNMMITMLLIRALGELQVGQRTLTPCSPTPSASTGSPTSFNKSSGDYHLWF